MVEYGCLSKTHCSELHALVLTNFSVSFGRVQVPEASLSSMPGDADTVVSVDLMSMAAVSTIKHTSPLVAVPVLIELTTLSSGSLDIAAQISGMKQLTDLSANIASSSSCNPTVVSPCLGSCLC